MAWAELDVLVLRIAATFHENSVALHGESIRRKNILRNSFGDTPVGWINGSDAAEVAVASLLHPERFSAALCYPTGSEHLNHHDIAEMLTQELGRQIDFQPVSRSEWRQELIDLSEAYPGGVVNPAMAGHISNVGEAVATRGAPPADSAALSALIGRARCRCGTSSETIASASNRPGNRDPTPTVEDRLVAGYAKVPPGGTMVT